MKCFAKSNVNTRTNGCVDNYVEDSVNHCDESCVCGASASEHEPLQSVILAVAAGVLGGCRF